MATIRQWEDDLSILSDREINNVEDALNVLAQWEIFEKEFGPFHRLARLRSIVSHESTKRLMNTVIT